MNTVTFWVSGEGRAEAIRQEFESLDRSHKITFKEDKNIDSTEITITEPGALDMICLFHAGISHGFKKGRRGF